MADRYFVLSGSEDGVYFDCITREEMLKRLTPDKWGGLYYGDKPIASEVPKSLDCFTGLLIIKGEIVVPRPKTTVTEYELP